MLFSRVRLTLLYKGTAVVPFQQSHDDHQCHSEGPTLKSPHHCEVRSDVAISCGTGDFHCRGWHRPARRCQRHRFAAPLGRWDVEDAVPYDYGKSFNRIRRGRRPRRPGDLCHRHKSHRRKAIKGPRRKPGGQAAMWDYARVRYRKVTTWARLQTVLMPKVPSPMPLVMLFSTAQATAVA